MKTIIKLPVSVGARIHVSVGHHITSDTLLAEDEQEKLERIIPVGKLLDVPSSSILKYLKKKIHDKVNIGEVIATKRGIFSSVSVKSPFSGQISELDLTKGVLTVSETSGSAKKKIFSQFSGKVTAVSANFIAIEVSGTGFHATKASGEDTIGTLFYLSGDPISIHDISSQEGSCIVLCRSLEEDTLMKSEVISMSGLITRKTPAETVLPWLAVDEEVFLKLIKNDGKTVWIWPEVKQIVVIE